MSQVPNSADFRVPDATAHAIELLLRQIDASAERQKNRIAHVETMVRELCGMLNLPEQDYKYDRLSRTLVFTPQEVCEQSPSDTIPLEELDL